MVTSNSSKEDFLVNFAVEMVRQALDHQVVWYGYEVVYLQDDSSLSRHLLIRVRRPHYFDVEGECFISESEATGELQGSVIIGHYGETGVIYSHDPEVFFEYHRESGLEEVRKVAIEILVENEIYTAQVLDNPDVTPSSRERRKSELPSAQGNSENEAVGKLVSENPELFRVLVRRASLTPALV